MYAWVYLAMGGCVGGVGVGASGYVTRLTMLIFQQLRHFARCYFFPSSSKKRIVIEGIDEFEIREAFFHLPTIRNRGTVEMGKCDENLKYHCACLRTNDVVEPETYRCREHRAKKLVPNRRHDARISSMPHADPEGKSAIGLLPKPHSTGNEVLFPKIS